MPIETYILKKIYNFSKFAKVTLKTRHHNKQIFNFIIAKLIMSTHAHMQH